MIPVQNIVAWGNLVPWADQRQVEQDLIIGCAPGEDACLEGTLWNLTVTRARPTMFFRSDRS